MQNANFMWEIYAWAGWLITTAILVGLYWLTGLIGTEVFKRLTRIYHFSVIGYWLMRLEKEGTHAFRRADGTTPGAPND